MKIFTCSLIVCFSVFWSVFNLNAAVTTYQPSPYKGTAVSFTPTYPDLSLSLPDLSVGGTGIKYYTAIKFDLVGLPANPNFVSMSLWYFSINSNQTLASYSLRTLTSDWSESSTWNSSNWTTSYPLTMSAPIVEMCNYVAITDQYNRWKSTGLDHMENYGFVLTPFGTDSQVNFFHSFNHDVSTYRPFLYIEYNETVTPPDFKLPLPGNKSWVVTTEIGGTDEQRWMTSDPYHIDPAHTDYNEDLVTKSSVGNYYSIDFGQTSIPASSGDIPILAAADGWVDTVGYNSGNGNYIVISHDTSHSVNNGYSTRYLHLDEPAKRGGRQGILLQRGDHVNRGEQVGVMGNTGISETRHLHFGVRYQNVGFSTTNELTFVKLEGRSLKQYQTEVTPETRNQSNYLNRVRSANSYYLSTNVGYVVPTGDPPVNASILITTQ